MNEINSIFNGVRKIFQYKNLYKIAKVLLTKNCGCVNILLEFYINFLYRKVFVVPISPPRICQKHKKPFNDQRCPICTEEWKRHNRSNDNRESPDKRGYDRQWGKVRKMKLSNNPFCERCSTSGKITPAKMVHHKDKNVWNRSFDNLESICKYCHDKEHKDEFFGNDKKNAGSTSLTVGDRNTIGAF